MQTAGARGEGRPESCGMSCPRCWRARGRGSDAAASLTVPSGSSAPLDRLGQQHRLAPLRRRVESGGTRRSARSTWRPHRGRQATTRGSVRACGYGCAEATEALEACRPDVRTGPERRERRRRGLGGLLTRTPRRMLNSALLLTRDKRVKRCGRWRMRSPRRSECIDHPAISITMCVRRGSASRRRGGAPRRQRTLNSA